MSGKRSLTFIAYIAVAMASLELSSHDISCPYCGETINIDVDHSIDTQTYVEDCQVCCQPIVFNVWVDEETNVPLISCEPEND